LASFANPLDPAEQQYIHEWSHAVQSFDPSL